MLKHPLYEDDTTQESSKAFKERKEKMQAKEAKRIAGRLFAEREYAAGKNRQVSNGVV